jgi:D-arabinose 5-phosphate isomerase GutQ
MSISVESRHWLEMILEKTAKQRKFLLQHVNNLRPNAKAVFLVGCGRSGTNMITRHLANTWQ